MSSEPRPRIVVSRCIEHGACRWNGLTIRSDTVRLLLPFVEFVPVCPEMEMGLGCPRDPVRLVETPGGPRLVQPATGRDCTAEMTGFCSGFLDSLGGAVDGFILKSRSPSCGSREVKLYASASARGGRPAGTGLFAAAVLERCAGLPIADEGRLRNYELRELFLTRIWAAARFRALRAAGKASALVEFHARSKFLLQAHSESGMRAMGRLVATGGGRGRGLAAALEEYGARLGAALSGPGTRGRHINVLMHAAGFFKKGVSSAEKEFFAGQLEAYRRGRLPLGAPLGVIQAWIARFGQEYLAAQFYFRPYPHELVSVSDSGTGRKLR